MAHMSNHIPTASGRPRQSLLFSFEHVSYSLNSLKGGLYRELYRGLLQGLLRGILGV